MCLFFLQHSLSHSRSPSVHSLPAWNSADPIFTSEHLPYQLNWGKYISLKHQQKINSTKFPMDIKISIRAERALTYVFSFWGFDFHVDLCQYQILAILLSIIIAKAWQKLNVTHAHQMDWEGQYTAGFFHRITNNWRFMFLKKRSRECPWWWCVRAIH